MKKLNQSSGGEGGAAGQPWLGRRQGNSALGRIWHIAAEGLLWAVFACLSSPQQRVQCALGPNRASYSEDQSLAKEGFEGRLGAVWAEDSGVVVVSVWSVTQCCTESSLWKVAPWQSGVISAL